MTNIDAIDVLGLLLIGAMITTILQTIVYVIQHWDERVK